MFYFSNKKLCWSTRTVRPCKKLITRPRPMNERTIATGYPGPSQPASQPASRVWKNAGGLDWTGACWRLFIVRNRNQAGVYRLIIRSKPLFPNPDSTRLEKKRKLEAPVLPITVVGGNTLPETRNTSATVYYKFYLLGPVLPAACSCK